VKRRALESKAGRAYLDSVPWVTDAAGKMIVQNGLWCDYLGFPVPDEEPVKFEDIVDPEELAQFAEHWANCIKLGSLMDTEIGLFDCLEGKYVAHKLVVVPHYGTDGLIEGWVGSAILK